jgi:hypothetical protein
LRRLDYYEKPNNDRFFIDQIDALKKEVDNKDYKIEILQQSINKIQSFFNLNNKFEFMQKLDIAELKYKLYEIEGDMEKKGSIFNKYESFQKEEEKYLPFNH